MQAKSYESASVRLSTEHKGRKRREPVWVGRYRLAGKDSAKVIGKAWTKRSRPPRGYRTRADAENTLRSFLEQQGAKLMAAGGVKFGTVADAYIASLEARIEAGDFRASTLRSYRNIIKRDLRPEWGERPIGTITREEVAAYRTRLTKRGLAAGTMNQHRAIVRGMFALAVRSYALEESPAVGFQWTRSRRATSGAMSFYRPDEVQRLAEHAGSEQDAAIFITAVPSPGCAPASFATSAGGPSTSPTRSFTSNVATRTRARNSCRSPTRFPGSRRSRGRADRRRRADPAGSLTSADR